MSSYLNSIFDELSIRPLHVQTDILNSIQENPQSFNPLLIPETRIETYQDLVTNLSPDELEELERKMQLLPDNKEINMNLILKAINQPNISDPIWKDQDFPLYALLALKQKKIDGMDFSASQMFYNVINHPNNKGQVQEIPLFINESINPQAWELIKETVQPFISQKYEEIIEKRIVAFQPFMTLFQQQVFFDMMSKLRPLQKIFLLIPEPQPVFSDLLTRIEISESGTVTAKINTKNPGFNVFCRVSDKEFGKPLRMIPSKGMMQAYLFATGGTSTLISQFGLASFQYLHKGISGNERCMCLNAPFLTKLVTQADRLVCLPQANEVEYHDFYHIDIMNLIRKDLVKFAGMAELMQKMSQKKSVTPGVDLLYTTWIDMEHLIYRLFYSKNLLTSSIIEGEALFWRSFCYNLQTVVVISKGALQQDSITNIIHAIMKELVEEADYYQKKYNLTVDFILNFELNLSKINLLKAENFPYIEILIEAVNKKLKFDYRTSNDQLIAFSKYSRSYLIRNAISRQLAEAFELERMDEFLTEFKKARFRTAYFMGLDFIVENFQSLVNDSTLSSKTKEFLLNELRNSPNHFEYLIKSAVLENNRSHFDLLMGADRLFKEKQINRVFNDGLTLWQTANFKKHQSMMEYLISLGAKPIEESFYSEPQHVQVDLKLNQRLKGYFKIK